MKKIGSSLGINGGFSETNKETRFGFLVHKRFLCLK